MYRLTRPDRAELSKLAALEANRDLPYETIGMSVGEVPSPSGLHHLHVQRDIGQGAARFESARSAIVSWAGHRRAGAFLEPVEPELVPGSVVALAIRIWPLWVTATCRVVRVIDEPNRFGFAYGTLPHHPAEGEESFMVIRNPETDVVQLHVVAYSRPATLLARLGGPVGRAFQQFTAKRYLDGFENPDQV